MHSVNPLALLIIAFAVVLGALLGHWLIGLAVGLALVITASML